ncbi:MAG: sigma-54-dependent Fis family transcriptional regulator [Magnetococcales bacterium]|nr:sigma-54-dependent Fis family transcriptional regulator [Magnetococcales bacterium]
MTKEELPPIVVVDDEADIRHGMDLLLRRAGFSRVVTIGDSRTVIDALERHGAAVLLLDLGMPHVSGQEILQQVNRRHPEIPVIIITAVHDLETAVACMKTGAVEFLLKPLEESRFLAAVRKAHENTSLRLQVATLGNYLLGEGLTHPEAFADILTRSRKMEAVFKYLEAAALTGEPLLITGETGTGKELLAQAFHRLRGGDRPFVAVNVAGLDDHMFSDTLFGHRKGAFTGADRMREGMVAKAAGGILFLDEIGDLSESNQVKLLRLLQERKYQPLGSDVYRNADITVVTATHQNLQERIQEGRFRRDLYYRLATHSVRLPPLRERSEDLPLLLAAFVEEAARVSGRDHPPAIPPEAIQVLGAYPFPGNVRELRAMTIDAVARSQHGMLSLKPWSDALRQPLVREPEGQSRSSAPLSWPGGVQPPTLKEAEDFLMHHALETSGGNQGVAAALLGITRQALNQRLARRAKTSKDNPT